MTETKPKNVEKGEVRTMRLPVLLNGGELAVRAQELGSAEALLTDAEGRLDAFIEAAKTTKGQIQDDISEHRQEVRRLAGIVRDRKELRDVAVVEEFDFDASAVNTVRTDSSEIVATRGMTHEERQRSLFRDAKTGSKKES